MGPVLPFCHFISRFDSSLSSKHRFYRAGISKHVCYTFSGREQKEFLIVSPVKWRRTLQRESWGEPRFSGTGLKGKHFIQDWQISNLSIYLEGGKLKLIAFPIDRSISLK